jgi:dipicolinate synthase subunit B
MLICPATGNTVSKIAANITDTPVTMAAKAHLRNERPLVIAVATNDGLGANAKSIGALLARKNIYFVPYVQDDPLKKPRSLVADFDKTTQALYAALKGEQIQPILF